MNTVKHAISLLIWNDDELLAVKRPPDDEELPEVWGLPAGSLRTNESYPEAIQRAGHEKLGVELEIGPLVHEGSVERDTYTLHMRLYRAAIAAGQPSVPQPVEGITQYTDWAWSPPDRLRPAARRGSLCSRLALASIDR